MFNYVNLLSMRRQVKELRKSSDKGRQHSKPVNDRDESEEEEIKTVGHGTPN